MDRHWLSGKEIHVFWNNFQILAESILSEGVIILFPMCWPDVAKVPTWVILFKARTMKTIKTNHVEPIPARFTGLHRPNSRQFGQKSKRGILRLETKEISIKMKILLLIFCLNISLIRGRWFSVIVNILSDIAHKWIWRNGTNDLKQVSF